MATRSVSFGEVEEQYYDDEAYDHDDDNYQEQDDEGGEENNEKETSSERKSSKSSSRNDNARASSSTSSLICPNCGSRQIEQQDASGASICMECGVVVEENAIVSSVEFVEGTGGASSMVGQFVSATSSKAYTGGGGAGGGGMMRGGRYGFSRESREATLANGRRRIQDVASRMRLGGHFVDTAHRLYTVAVEKNFVKGRKGTHVVAACLYIATRQEKSQHMLIDFSDALQVNVYTLGATFLKFRRLLGIKLEIIDPALYIYRFAAHLDLEEKANAVGMTALRLVARMKRDWIITGRRPAGICAAALLIAARAHGFSRHHQDVTRILRVCGLTVTTRVKEFEQTPTSNLTLSQFHDVELESEADPPAYTKNKINEARAKAIEDNNVQLLNSGLLDDPMRGKFAKRWRDPKRHDSDRKVKFKSMYADLEKELATSTQSQSTYEQDQQQQHQQQLTNQAADGESASIPAMDDGGIGAEIEDDVAGSNDKEEEPLASEKEEGDEVATKGDEGTTMNQESQRLQKTAGTLQQIVVRKDPHQERFKNSAYADAYPKASQGKAMILPEFATEEEMQQPSAPVEAQLSLTHWKEDMPDEMADEIDNMFRSDEEVAQKELIFNRINKDYLTMLEQKANDPEASKRKDSRRGRKRKNKAGDDRDSGNEEGLTTEEALMAAMSTKKVSRKINYDAMSAIFDEKGSFATNVSEAGHDEEGGEEMYGVL